METSDASRLQQTLPKQNHRDIESGLTDQLEAPLLSSQDEERVKVFQCAFSLICGVLFSAALFNPLGLSINLTLAAKILMVVAGIVALVYCVKNCVAPISRRCVVLKY